MGHVRDMHLKAPAFRSLFDVDGIVKITRRLAIDGYNRQMAKIPASLAFGSTYGTGR